MRINKPYFGRARTKSTRGFALMAVMAFVMVLAAVVMAVTRFSTSDLGANKARMAAEELRALSRAARLEIRDRMRDNGVQATKNSLATAPVLVTFQTLQQKGYLPASFNGQNQFRQPMYVILANSPVDGDPANSQTVPAAYVIAGQSQDFQDHPEVGQKAMALVTQRLKEFGLSVNAPGYTYNAAASKFDLAVECSGASILDGVGSWDTGCMTLTAYNKIRTAMAAVSNPPALPDPANFSGALVIPTWRSVDMDSRILSRYPVPENPSINSMNADLYMGKPNGTTSTGCGSNHEKITVIDPTRSTDDVLGLDKNKAFTVNDASGNTRTVCTVINDVDPSVDPVSPDRRFDISNAASLSGGYSIVNPQSKRVVGTTLDTTTKTDLGNVNVLNGKALVARSAGGAGDTTAALQVVGGVDVAEGVQINNGTTSEALNLQDATVNVVNTSQVFTAKDDVSVNGSVGVGNASSTGIIAQLAEINSSSAAIPVTANTITLRHAAASLNADDVVIGKMQPETVTGKSQVDVTAGTANWGSGITAPLVVGVYGGSGTVSANEVKLSPSGSGTSTVEVGGLATIQRVDTDVCTGNCPRDRSWVDCQYVNGLKVCKPKGGQ